MSGVISRKGAPRRPVLRQPLSLRIDMACNDPDSGIFAHRVEMLAIAEPIFSLSIRKGEALKFDTRPGQIRLCRRWWPVLRSKDWVGNWCWNSYSLPWAEGIELLAALHKTDKYGCDEAAERLYELWEAEEFDARKFATSLARELRSEGLS